MENIDEINKIKQQTENIQLDTPKNKLKDLFSEIDKEKKPKPKNITTSNKNNYSANTSKISDLKKSNKVKEKEYEDTVKKTKPTKPDFSQQFIDSGISGPIGLSKKNSNESMQYKGLTNFGNICYSNVVIQCLIALKEFVQMLNTIFDKLQDVDGLDMNKNFPVLSHIVKIQNYYDVKNTSLASGQIKLLVNMFDSSGEQNDAHEFLVFIFDKLNDEILKISNYLNVDLNINNKSSVTTEETEWEEVKKGGKRMKQVNTVNSFQISIIGNIFQGILKHELESKGNSLSKCNIEPFFVLSLDFGEDSLISCFEKFFERRRIEHEIAPIFQKSYIEKLPKILIVHLKAFYFDKNTKRIVKINKEIKYDSKIKIDKKLVSPGMQNVYKNCEYELISGKVIFLIL
jgi:ubiquitin C-terminal hydrolase